MSLLPDLWWPSLVLALVLLGDAVCWVTRCCLYGRSVSFTTAWTGWAFRASGGGHSSSSSCSLWSDSSRTSGSLAWHQLRT